MAASNASVGVLYLGPSDYYDVALRDLGLALSAFALSRLAIEFNTRS